MWPTPFFHLAFWLALFNFETVRIPLLLEAIFFNKGTSASVPTAVGFVVALVLAIFPEAILDQLQLYGHFIDERWFPLLVHSAVVARAALSGM